MTIRLSGVAAAASLLLFASAASADDAAAIKSALAAAPAAVAAKAAVIDVGMDGKIRELRKGGNGFTCMADNPGSPGKDPMCLDANGLEWAKAWMGRTTPPAGKIGFGYMLVGGSDASNTDPHASKPKAGAKWVDTGPHVMIFNYAGGMAGYPKQGDNPDTKVPYVMWAGTPYEHLMIPVR